jgi:hypothetical protein
MLALYHRMNDAVAFMKAALESNGWKEIAPEIVMAAAGLCYSLKSLLQGKLPRIRWQIWSGKWQAASDV